MKTIKAIQIIETHTEGQPTRIVTGGFPIIPGKTMQEKYTYMRCNGDWLRKLVCSEPRGNEHMSAALLTEPCITGTDIGVLYFESGGWLPMCGHDTIGVATACVDMGLVPVTEPYTYIKLDTPAGVIQIKVEVCQGEAKQVYFINAPAFVMKKNITIDVPSLGPIKMDISWGGNVYAILPVASTGLEICPENSTKLVETAVSLRKSINEQIKIQHPIFEYINQVTHIEFFGKPKNCNADIQNCVIAPVRILDRSPCGTGTSAKAAVLAAEGKLNVGESFVHESIIGSLFTCRNTGETKVRNIPAIYTEIGGRAYIMSLMTLFLTPEDPFPEGFMLG